MTIIYLNVVQEKKVRFKVYYKHVSKCSFLEKTISCSHPTTKNLLKLSKSKLRKINCLFNTLISMKCRYATKIYLFFILIIASTF